MSYATNLSLVAVALAATLGGAPRADAKSLDDALEEMASQVEAFLGEKQITTALVRDFSGPSDVGTGKLLTQTLTGKLSELGIQKGSALGGDQQHKLEGNFAFDSDRKIIVVNARLHDANGAVVDNFRQRVTVQEIDTLADINQLFPSNTDFQQATSDVVAGSKAKVKATPVSSSASQLKTAQLDAIGQSRLNDGRSFDRRPGGAIAASSSSPFELQVLIERGGSLEPIEIADLNGFAFAPLQEGDVYNIRVRNNARHDIAVELSIDGVNTLSLSEVEPYRKHGRWVVLAGREAIVRGWHRGAVAGALNEYFKFEVTTEENGVAREIGLPSSQIGSIQATVYHAWDPAREPTPAIEQAGQVGKTLGLATGRGASVNVRTTQIRRLFGKQPLASIAVRYENPDISNLPTDAPPQAAAEAGTTTPSNGQNQALAPAL